MEKAFQTPSESIHPRTIEYKAFGGKSPLQPSVRPPSCQSTEGLESYRMR